MRPAGQVDGEGATTGSGPRSRARASLARGADRLARGAPWLARPTGYRVVDSAPIVDHAHSHAEATTTHLAPPHAGGPLPGNITSGDLLPSDRSTWGRSFQDVPTRVRSAPCLLAIPDGQVVVAADRFGLEHFSLLAPGPTLLKGTGLRWTAGHRQALVAARRDRSVERVDEATWIWESWWSNHSHWLLRHVAKLAMCRDLGLLPQVVRTPGARFRDVHLRSLAAMGIDLEDQPRMRSSVLQAAQLSVLHIPAPHPYQITMLRSALEHLRAPERGRRIYISRRNAKGRRITNEEEVRSLLLTRGFEELLFEELTFEEQVRASSEAAVVVGLHGAGLTNAALCHPGSHLIELVNPVFAKPSFYELAVVAGLTYWMVAGEPAPGPATRGYADTIVPLDDLAAVLDQV